MVWQAVYVFVIIRMAGYCVLASATGRAIKGTHNIHSQKESCNTETKNCLLF